MLLCDESNGEKRYSQASLAHAVAVRNPMRGLGGVPVMQTAEVQHWVCRGGWTLDFRLLPMPESARRGVAEGMSNSCTANSCKSPVPSALEAERVCILHFTLAVEQKCAEMRRETVLGRAPRERQLEIIQYISQSGELLARTATSGLHLADDMKARVLNTFLTLMNLRENLDRAALRQPIGRGR
jgi:hypothetical protein